MYYQGVTAPRASQPSTINHQPSRASCGRLRFSVKPDRLDAAAELLQSIDSALSAAPWIADEIVEAFLAANNHEVCDAIRIAQACDHRVVVEEVAVDEKVRWQVFVVRQKTGSKARVELCRLLPVDPPLRRVAARQIRKEFVQTAGIHIDSITGQCHCRRRDGTSFRREPARSGAEEIRAPPRVGLKELRHVELEPTRIIEATGTSDWAFPLPFF